jgi:NAD(P)-dependent dehydrogenase (short-subunit alcohol dehydrogenase family)
MNILITGAGKGIGYATALALMANDSGHRIIGLSRDVSALKATENKGIIPLAFDLEKDRISGKFSSMMRNHTDHIDVFIHCAGVMINKAFEDLAEDDYLRLTNVHFKSFFFLVQELAPMMPPGSHILSIASMGGFQGSVKFPGLSLYSASKAAVACLSECLALELSPKKISVNCLAPGAVQTEMLATAFPGYKAAVSSTEMGNYIAEFALTGHRYMNGKIIPLSLTTP